MAHQNSNFNSLIFLLLCPWRIFPAVRLTTASNLYKFGSSSGDSKLTKNDDGSSGVLDISISFPYFDRNHDKLYVNTNGVISFLNPVSQYTPDPFPLGNDRRLLTPFWADVDTTKGGDVWYRETTDTILLFRALFDIRNAILNFQKFTPTWLYVATWDKVASYGSDENNNKRNTFQAILATNGRHSFVIYIYDRIEWLAGTLSDGIPAQCGFNAGDGKVFYTIAGSRTKAVLNLSKTSNVGRPGVWIFQVDNAEIQSHGCNTKGRLTISPRNVLMLGGENIYIAGPCFSKDDDKIICKFGGKKKIRGSYIDGVKAKCVAPMISETGRIQLQVSLDDGNTYSFRGFFNYVTVLRQKPRVRRSLQNDWMEGKHVGIQWDANKLGDNSKRVNIAMANYKMKGSEIRLDRVVSISNQTNNGTSTIRLPTEGSDIRKDNSDDRSVSIIRVSKNSAHTSDDDTPNEWIWSEVFSVINSSRAPARCKYWQNNEPDPSTFREDRTLLPCPHSILQALVDRGSYVIDEICDGKNRESCEKYHPKANKCFRTIRPSSKGAGQQCCYNTAGNLIDSRPGAGHLDRAHIDAGIPYISHYFHDILPYHECCLLSKNCGDYYDKRPNDDGLNYDPPRAASGIGDPHMVTLDGVEYTFNGLGEYVLLNVEPIGFCLQGRMEQLPPRNGTHVNATVYTAFAMKENGSDTMEIRLNGRGFMDVVINGELQDFDDEQETDFKNLIVMKEVNSSKYSTIFNSGIAVITEGFSSLMQFTVMMPKQFKKNTSGLLGYWDDNLDQEFLLPNGLFLNTSSNSKTIHYEFGLRWATQAHQSLFTYGPGKSHQTYSRPQFIPEFVDLNNIVFDNPVLERNARSTCGDSIQCLFDVKATGDTNIGLTTKNSIQQVHAIINITETKACVPLDSRFSNGFIQRNDSDQRITYSYRCKPEFHFNGSSVVSCFQGNWNGTAPSCLPLKECPSVKTTILNGKVSSRGRLPTYGSAVYFECAEGYDLIGAQSIVCGLDSTWSSKTPRCRKRCPRVAIANGNTTYNETEHHVTAYISCIKGSTVIGPHKIICTKSNGTWNAAPRSCQPVGPVEHQFDSNGNRKALIIGVTLGVILSLILCIVVIGYIIFKRKFNRKPSQEAFRMEQEETVNILTKAEQKERVKVAYL